MNNNKNYHNDSISAGDVENQIQQENKLAPLTKRNDDHSENYTASDFFVAFNRNCSEPESKKLRSCEADLQIYIGSDQNREVRWCHSALIANYSGFIDTLLANPMEEGQTTEINLPDISSEKWDLMLKYLENPTEARKMTIEDAMTLAKEYDEYDMIKGRQLCSQVLAEYFKETTRQENKKAKKCYVQDAAVLNAVVDAVVLAHEANLDAKKEGMKYLRKKMKVPASPYNANMFTEDHIKKIVPVLIAEEDLDIGWRKDEIDSPEFPSLFISKHSELNDYEDKRKTLALIFTLLVVSVALMTFCFG